jgi:cytochrome c-type biogenesis protein CcmH/NrfG
MGRESTRNVAARHARAAVLSRAEALLQVRDAWNAAVLAKAVLKVDRDHVGALEVLARALWQENRFAELIVTLKHMIRLDPYEPGYRSLLGASYQCLGMYGEAVKAFAACAAAQNQDAQRPAKLAIAEIQDWQSRLVADMLRDDPAFRAEYSRNPREACRARGFEFLSDGEALSEPWVPDRSELTATAARPS